MNAQTFSGITKALGTRLDEFEELPLPVHVLDRNGSIVWMNRVGRELHGNVIGHNVREFFAPEYRQTAVDHFLRKMLGTETSSTYEAEVMDPGGRRRGATLNTIALTDGHRAVGVFGIAEEVTSASHGASVPGLRLSPRQLEALRHLESGASTSEIAGRMGISLETARNHIRGVLRGLGVHSRLEAVVEAKRRRAA